MFNRLSINQLYIEVIQARSDWLSPFSLQKFYEQTILQALRMSFKNSNNWWFMIYMLYSPHELWAWILFLWVRQTFFHLTTVSRDRFTHIFQNSYNTVTMLIPRNVCRNLTNIAKGPNPTSYSIGLKN